MRITFTKQSTLLAASCAIALGAFSANVGAQQNVSEHTIVTSSSDQPVMSGFGLCVHSGFGSAIRDAIATHSVRVAFDSGSTRDVSTDYDLRKGDRVTMLSDGKAVGFEPASLSTAGCRPAVALAPVAYVEKTIP